MFDLKIMVIEVIVVGQFITHLVADSVDSIAVVMCTNLVIIVQAFVVVFGFISSSNRFIVFVDTFLKVLSGLPCGADIELVRLLILIPRPRGNLHRVDLLLLIRIIPASVSIPSAILPFAMLLIRVPNIPFALINLIYLNLTILLIIRPKRIPLMIPIGFQVIISLTHMSIMSASLLCRLPNKVFLYLADNHFPHTQIVVIRLYSILVVIRQQIPVFVPVARSHLFPHG